MQSAPLFVVVPLLLAAPVAARAEEAETRERPLTTGEIESWLEAEPGQKPVDQGTTPADDAPLPAPRAHGLVVESGLGFVTQVGSLKHITPTAPWFQLRVGYEVLSFLMPFVEADLAVASTAYATEPPPPRSYFHYGAGLGLRGTIPIGSFGILLQGSVGFAEVSEQNVLSIYGFPDADEPNLYVGGELGLEWYQVSPHLALALHGGVRHYGAGLERSRGGEPPLAALGNATLRYAF
jgi:hypothetical protein